MHVKFPNLRQLMKECVMFARYYSVADELRPLFFDHWGKREFEVVAQQSEF